jgi:hypothetical protein
MTETFYPGSKRKRKDYEDEVAEPQEEEDVILSNPRTYLVGGKSAELYPLGAVAQALNRKPVTVRKLEQEGILPRAPLILPSHDQRGQRRLYTKAHIDGLRKIAAEEGVLFPSPGGKWKSIEATQFRDKALKLFKELNG